MTNLKSLIALSACLLALAGAPASADDFYPCGASVLAQMDDHDVLGPGAAVTYRAEFQAGQEIFLMVNGDGSTDLDLWVHDENGNLIASDTDLTDQCIAHWTPAWTGTFTIRVENLGDSENAYAMHALPVLGSDQDVAGPSSRVTYWTDLPAGQPVLVMALGDGGTDLDLRVLDQDGRSVGADLDLTDQCIVVFTPSRSQEFMFLLDNLGDRGNAFTFRIVPLPVAADGSSGLVS